jgi:glycosyltransferase involved in cell wall biosynthesis
MCCYNTQKYIEDSITSVINQSYKDWELIVINDGSNDGSLRIINKFVKRNKKIKVINLKKNYGQAYARNIGIKISRGKWISILDADDIFSLNKLEEQSSVIKNLSKHYVLVGTSSVLIDKKGKRINNILYHYPSKSYFMKKNLYEKRKFPPHSSIAYKRSALKKIGFFDERFKRTEDVDLWLKLSLIGNFTSTKKTFISNRIHNDNISTSNRLKFSAHVYSLLARILHLARLQKLEKNLERIYSFNKLLILTEKYIKKTILYNKNKKLNKIKKNFFSSLINFKNIKFILLLLLERYGVYKLERILLKKFINN